ncbi:bidirectional sugar transporter SWEET6b-like [Malania oleifera]|uniref:bidirectional sugar transporter SWEET6b-like n=1 Tax=Malania oleifera TaxID=397392 RepID=UPI0025AE1C9A|nr:bidirectional sugar transporter SWEET6b-like [Malania oleifera]
MTSADTARTIVGVIGNVISFCLFASPAPTFWRILKKKTTEEFQPYPYIATILNCLFWIFYGLPLVHPHSTLVVTINAIGLAIEIIYTTIFFIYTNNKGRMKVIFWVCVEIAFMAGIVALTLLKFHSHTARSNFVGIFCVVFGVMMYTSPLAIMKKVITTKSVEYMPFYLSLANFLNGVIWVTYALIKFDLYITIGNGLGALSGAVQLILYAIYYKSTPKKGSDNEKPSGVQLSSAPQASAV